MFKRKIYDKLLEWKKQNGSTSLLIEGARRIGKSTIVENFAQNEYKTYIMIDFSDTTNAVRDLFNDGSDLSTFFFSLSLLTGVSLHERETLIIFDEVQMFPRARQLTKKLVLDGKYDYILTGSLLSIRSNKAGILLPSEEDSLKMFPLDFEEFLWANNRMDLVSVIRERFLMKKPMDNLHSLIMKYFRQYLFVGGMPQAVVEFMNTSDFTKVDKIKRRILKLYRDDIGKYAETYEKKVRAIFDDIPAQLSSKEKRFRLSSLGKEARLRDYEDAFMWLEDAMITNSCFNSRDPQHGLSLYLDRPTFKTYFIDSGLLLAHAFNEKEFMEQKIAQEIINDNLSFNNGMIIENVVAQLLISSGKKLFFYYRNVDPKIEIDFLIYDPWNHRKISPIEVKSSKKYTTISLDRFSHKFSDKITNSIIIHTKDMKITNNTFYVPIYMTHLL